MKAMARDLACLYIIDCSPNDRSGWIAAPKDLIVGVNSAKLPLSTARSAKARKATGPRCLKALKFPESTGGHGELQCPEELLHALQTAIEFRFRSRVRNTNMLACTEALTRDRCHMRVTQQPAGYIRCRFQASAAKKR